MKTVIIAFKRIILATLLISLGIIVIYFLEILAGHDVTEFSKHILSVIFIFFGILGIYLGIYIEDRIFHNSSIKKVNEIVISGKMTLVEILKKYDQMKDKMNYDEYAKYIELNYHIKELIRTGQELPGGIINIIKQGCNYKIVDFKNNSFIL